MTRGSSFRRDLIAYAKDRLVSEGARVLSYNAGARGSDAEVIGVRGGRVVAVKCYTQVQLKNLRRVLARLRGRFDEIIVCVPDETEAGKLADLERDVIVWVAGLDRPVSVRLPRRLVRRLESMRRGEEEVAEVIERLLASAGDM
ncbi:MAG: hypothetical protein QXO15_00070 [Nitrososphaerota archaeon]